VPARRSDPTLSEHSLSQPAAVNIDLYQLQRRSLKINAAAAGLCTMAPDATVMQSRI
jgi:hypothetical protein